MIGNVHTKMIGFVGILLLGYTLLLVGIHIFIPHPAVTKNRIRLSYTSLSMIVIAQICVVATYFLPHLDGLCICHFEWTTAGSCYVFSLYGLKLIYLDRIEKLNQHPKLGTYVFLMYL